MPCLSRLRRALSHSKIGPAIPQEYGMAVSHSSGPDCAVAPMDAARPEQADGFVEGETMDGLARRAAHAAGLRWRGTARNGCSGQVSPPRPRPTQAKAAPPWGRFFIVMSSPAELALETDLRRTSRLQMAAGDRAVGNGPTSGAGPGTCSSRTWSPCPCRRPAGAYRPPGSRGDSPGSAARAP